MGDFEAVLFDFGHTLFDTLPVDEHCRRFEQLSGMAVDRDAFDASWTNIREQSRSPEELAKGRDLSAALHQQCWLNLLAPLDDLAAGLAQYVCDAEASVKGWRPYPDAAPVMAELARRGKKIGVVSNCGWDIRTNFKAYELDKFVDAFVLSCEVGAAKPDLVLFEEACNALQVAAASTIMVGDHPVAGGAAAALGITCLILPGHTQPGPRGLGAALDLAE